jgi:hypothetical protein
MRRTRQWSSDTLRSIQTTPPLKRCGGFLQRLGRTKKLAALRRFRALRKALDFLERPLPLRPRGDNEWLIQRTMIWIAPLANTVPGLIRSGGSSTGTERRVSDSGGRGEPTERTADRRP